MYFNADGKEEVTYDAIVIGSGISGGWAAKELTEKGLKTIVLERGRMVKHGDYPTAGLDPWDLENRDRFPQEYVDKHYPKQSRTGYTVKPSRAHFFVKDDEHPYSETKRFDWMRGYHVGGRSLMWGRQSYRLGDLDFEANAKDGFGVDWPIRYKDIAPWYSYVERFAGISGSKDGLPQLPDGEFLPPMDLNCVEKVAKERIEKAFPERNMIIGRVAHLTQPNPDIHINRGQCQSRNRCMRGCPYGAYFSSNSATLPAAERTGNLTIRPFSIVHSIMYDKDSGRATGVRIIDTETKETHEFFAKVVFLCASALGSTSILMQSKSEAHPNGMGNASGELGHNLMDHHFRTGARGNFEGMEDQYYEGRRPNGVYVPRFRNISPSTKMPNFLRGYGYQGGASRTNWMRGVKELAMMGEDLKNELIQPGGWQMGIGAFGECLPYHENKMTLDYDNLDQWGLP
ncbi:MAG: GMC family oxidoreductase, partial [Bacteroidota bacterium]